MRTFINYCHALQVLDLVQATIKQFIIVFYVKLSVNLIILFRRQLFRVTINILTSNNFHIVAVKRCYQNVRRSETEQQDGNEEYVELQAKRRKYRSRRERVY